MGARIEFAEDEYLKGLDDILNKIQDEVEKLEHKSTQGLADALLYVATESQQRAPVDTGDLRGSVLVELDGVTYAEGEKNNTETNNSEENNSDDKASKKTDRKINIVGELPEHAKKGSVSYNTEYAATQHEQINYDHPKGGQSKYLESVLIDEQDRILKTIADKMIEE